MHDVLCSTDDESARRADLTRAVARGDEAAVAHDLQLREQAATRDAARNAHKRAAKAARVQANTPANSAEGQRVMAIAGAAAQQADDAVNRHATRANLVTAADAHTQYDVARQTQRIRHRVPEA